MKKGWTKEDFIAKLIPNGDCLEWPLAKNSQGYGITRINSKEKMYAHRLALQLEGVDIKDLMVLHSCDNPSCCNSAHLRTGTAVENTADMIARKRLGDIAKITEEQVLEIRSLRQTGLAQWRIAEEYGISQAQVCRIIQKAHWKHLK